MGELEFDELLTKFRADLKELARQVKKLDFKTITC